MQEQLVLGSYLFTGGDCKGVFILMDTVGILRRRLKHIHISSYVDILPIVGRPALGKGKVC